MRNRASIVFVYGLLAVVQAQLRTRVHAAGLRGPDRVRATGADRIAYHSMDRAAGATIRVFEILLDIRPDRPSAS